MSNGSADKKVHWGWLPVPTALVALCMLVREDAWLAMMGFHLWMLAALLVHRRSIDWRRFFAWPSGRLFVAHLVAASLLTTALSVAVYAYANRHSGYGDFLDKHLTLHAVYPATRLLFALQLCLLNPLLEELFWRGLFFCDRKRPAATDLCYAAFHFYALLPFMTAPLAAIGTLGLVGFGYFLRQLARCQDRSLILPLVWHVLGDLAVVVAIARLTG